MCMGSFLHLFTKILDITNFWSKLITLLIKKEWHSLFWVYFSFFQWALNIRSPGNHSSTQNSPLPWSSTLKKDSFGEISSVLFFVNLGKILTNTKINYQTYFSKMYKHAVVNLFFIISNVPKQSCQCYSSVLDSHLASVILIHFKLTLNERFLNPPHYKKNVK